MLRMTCLLPVLLLLSPAGAMATVFSGTINGDVAQATTCAISNSQSVGTGAKYRHACAEAWAAVEKSASASSRPAVPTEGWVRYDEIDATAMFADERTVFSCTECPLGFPGSHDEESPFASCVAYDCESKDAPPADCPLLVGPTLVRLRDRPQLIREEKTNEVAR